MAVSRNEAGDTNLIGRRNVSETGDYDLGYDTESVRDQLIDYQAAYWNLPKRTTLWKVDAATLTVSAVMHLPGRVYTCFPENIALDDKTHLLFNYTSPLDGTDPTWIEGQTGLTEIYSTVLKLP